MKFEATDKIQAKIFAEKKNQWKLKATITEVNENQGITMLVSVFCYVNGYFYVWRFLFFFKETCRMQ